MRQSRLLSTTLRETKSEFQIISHDLMIRAGYIRQLSSGLFSYLNLGYRSIRKIEQIIREEMDAIDGVEINMPVVHPAEIWRATGRYDDIDATMVRFQDRTEKDLVLAMTHEEVVASLTQSDVQSYKQLPIMVYQIQTKFRDELRPRGGLIRTKEFIMKDAYTLDKDWEGLEEQYNAQYYAYYKIFHRMGMPVLSIQSDVGMMGGRVAHEFMYITDIGEDTIFRCKKTLYRANKEIATFEKVYPNEEAQPLEKVHTPGTKTITEVSTFLGVEAKQTGKAVFMMGDDKEGNAKLILAVVRGDMELNAVKLANLTKMLNVRPAHEEEIAAVGAVAGYASALGIDRDKSVVVVDDLVANSPNLIMGANEMDYHLKNVCYERDYSADMVGDIVSAFEGAPTPGVLDDPEAVLYACRGVEVGNIFQLGTKYTEGLDANFMDVDGRPKPVIMGSYGIGVGRALACLAEEFHDDKGLCLPIMVAPFQVHLIGLLKGEETIEKAETLYKDLEDAGIEVLFDDRGMKVASPGIKFNDADLIGIPIRLVISGRSLQNGGVEMKKRTDQESTIVGLEDVLPKVKAMIDELMESQVVTDAPIPI